MKTFVFALFGLLAVFTGELCGQVPPAEQKNSGVAPAVPKPGNGFGVPPAVPEDPPVAPAVPKPGFGVPPAEPKPGFGVPPAEPKPGSGVPPAEPKPGFGVPPVEPKNPGRVPPAVPKPGISFGGPLPAVPKNPDGSAGVLPAEPKNPDGTPLPRDEITRRNLCGQHSNADMKFDQQTRQCHRINTQGPCSENMMFYYYNTIYGQCDCNRRAPVPLVYYPRANACYYIYQQAYCPPGQWLAFSRKENKPLCTPNPCLSSRLKKQPWTLNVVPDVVPLNGNGFCVRLSDTGVCKNGVDEVGFDLSRVVPTCYNPNRIDTKFMAPIGPLPCAAGSRPSILGNCNPSIDWDF